MSMAELVPILFSASLTQASPGQETIQQCLAVLFPVFQLEILNWIEQPIYVGFAVESWVTSR